MVLFSQGGAGENDIGSISFSRKVVAGTKDSSQVYRPPSAGLRPLIVSRVKCGADLVAATKRFREREIRYAFIAPLLRNCGKFDIGLPETRSGRDRVLPI